MIRTEVNNRRFMQMRGTEFKTGGNGGEWIGQQKEEDGVIGTEANKKEEHGGESSVAEPDPGSGTVPFCPPDPGSGIGFFRIPDPGSDHYF